MEKRLVTATFYKFFFPTLASSVVLSVISMTDLIIAGHFVGENALTAISLQKWRMNLPVWMRTVL